MYEFLRKTSLKTRKHSFVLPPHPEQSIHYAATLHEYQAAVDATKVQKRENGRSRRTEKFQMKYITYRKIRLRKCIKATPRHIEKPICIDVCAEGRSNCSLESNNISSLFTLSSFSSLFFSSNANPHSHKVS